MTLFYALEEAMSFDPDQVIRYQGFLAEQPDRTGDEMWVLESDYDQLLQLYREMLRGLGCPICGQRDLADYKAKTPTVCQRCWDSAVD
jgi:hypothetical protein